MIDSIYDQRLASILNNICEHKSSISNKLGNKKFDIDIVPIQTVKILENGSKPFGAFYHKANRIEIYTKEIINVVGMDICYKKMSASELSDEVFDAYVLYIITHEMYHAYIFNKEKWKYLRLMMRRRTKKDKKQRRYAHDPVEIKADKFARQYLSELSDVAGIVAELATGLREGKDKDKRRKDETLQESREKYIERYIRRIKSLRLID